MDNNICCDEPKVLAVYLTAYGNMREPRWYCANFVRQHPGEFQLVRDANQGDG